MSAPPTDTVVPVDVSPGRVPMVTVPPGQLDDPATWVAARRAALRSLVTEHGSVLVRGLGLRDAEQVSGVFRELASELMSDEEGFAQRQRRSDGTYSSVEWPDHQQMCMHHELSYRRVVPALLLLACLTAPAEGGATGLADAGAVLEALPAELVERCEREGWLLTRTYGGDIGPSLVEGFGSADPSHVEDYCRAHEIEAEWLPDGVLRTRQRRPAVVRHPVDGRRLWFNQVAFLSEWTLDPEVREFLVEMYGADALPFATAAGDGSPVDEPTVAAITAAYESLTVREPWLSGDLLLVDNLATAHSRDPFEGPREVLVGLGDPTSISVLAPAFSTTPGARA